MKAAARWKFALPPALILALFAASVPAAPGVDIDRLQTIAERLFMNDRDLEEVYRDLRGYAQYTPDGQDRQLDYIQKLSLLVDRTRVQGYFLWRMLSVFDYLDASRRSDFLTLYEKELRHARDDIRMSITLIELYAAHIERKEIRKTLQAAVGLIEANAYMYEELEELISPHLNTPPYPRRID